METGKIKNKIYLLGIIIFFAMAVYFSFKMRDYIAYIDEAGNVTAIHNLMNEGRPRVGAYKDTVNYVEQPIERVFWEYSLETILRIPMYYLAKYFGVNSLQYITNIIFCLILIVLSVLYIEKKNIAILYKNIVGYLFLLIAISPGLMKLFHYTRYYSLAMSSFLLSVIIIPLLLNKLSDVRKKTVLILFIAALPVFFHMFYIIFFGIVFFIVFADIFKKRRELFKNFKLKRDNKIEIIICIPIVAIALFMGIVIAYRVIFVGGIKLFKISNSTYFLANTIGSSIWEYVILMLIVISLFINYKSIKDEVKTMLCINSIYLGGGILCSVIIGSNMWESTRYYISYRISYLIIIAIAINSFLVNTKIREIINIAFALILIFSGSSFKTEYANLPLISKEEIIELKNNFASVANIDYSNIIMFSDATLYFYDEIPDMRCYLFRDYVELEELDKAGFNGSVNYYKDINGMHRLDNGQVYAGKFNDYVKILEECEDDKNTYIVFWSCNLKKAEEKFLNYLQDTGLYNVGKAISVEEHKKVLNNYLKNASYY